MDYQRLLDLTEKVLIFRGGPTSGNWGHFGRPGKKGGSGRGFKAAEIEKGGINMHKDVVLYKTEYLSLIERDGWYYFAQVPGSIGGVCVLLYRPNDKLPILGRYEICPAHGDGMALTTIAGGIEKSDTPLETAVNEAYEEGGYKIKPDTFVDLGKCQLSTNQDTVIYLFSADVTNLPRYDAPGDGTKGEICSYCDWISIEEAIFSKSAFMSALIARLKFKEGIDLLSTIK